VIARSTKYEDWRTHGQFSDNVATNVNEIHLLHDDRRPVVEAIVGRTMEQTGVYVPFGWTVPNYQDVTTFLQVERCPEKSKKGDRDGKSRFLKSLRLKVHPNEAGPSSHTPKMSLLSLCCVIENEDIVFPVEIPAQARVSALKKEIQRERALWIPSKVSVLTPWNCGRYASRINSNVNYTNGFTLPSFSSQT
jgi:hypothetical protein